MSSGGNVEGYLLKVDGNEARVVYCIMDEGILQYYSHKGGELVGCIPLTGAKVDVFLLPHEPGRVANQFRVDSTVRPVRKRGSQSRAQTMAAQCQRSKSITTFAASSPAIMEKWAVSILNWNRYSWDDPQTLYSAKDERAALADLLRGLAPNVTLVKQSSYTSYVPVGVSRAIQPL
jgi:hypothetical protein